MPCFCDIAAPDTRGGWNPLPVRAQSPAAAGAQSECGGAAGGWSRSSTMPGHSFPWLLPLVLLEVFGRPLDTSSRPVGYTGPSAPLAEEPEQWDAGPGTTPLGHVELHRRSCAALEQLALLAWSRTFLDLLAMGVLLGWWLGKRLRRGRREEKHQSPAASAETGCQRQDCCKKLLLRLRDTRALMRLCLRHLRLQRPRAKRRRKWGLWNRRRLYFSPARCLSRPAPRLSVSAGDA
nr:uncharacterized protein LOC115493725 [Taeniopygia guttata]